MMGFDRLKRQWLRFQLEEAGSAIVEMLMMMPILVWAFVANIQFFDAYRANLIATKATLTIADMLSREAVIDTQYLEGTHKLLKYLTRADDDPDFRITVFYWSDDEDKYIVSWSKPVPGRDAQTTATINLMEASIPILSDAERAILVETWTDYEPKYGRGISYMANKGLSTIEYANALVISPRFTGSLCFNDTPENITAAVC